MMPYSMPVDVYPESVSYRVLEGEKGGRQTFIYTIGESIEIKHVFTCNRPSVQEHGNRLFRDIQIHVPMTWQGAKTRLASGASRVLLVRELTQSISQDRISLILPASGMNQGPQSFRGRRFPRV